MASIASRPDTAGLSVPATRILPFNRDWLFAGGVRAQPEQPAFSPVTLPHCVAKLSCQNWIRRRGRMFGGEGAIWIRTVPGGRGRLRLALRHSDLGTKIVEIEAR